MHYRNKCNSHVRFYCREMHFGGFKCSGNKECVRLCVVMGILEIVLGRMAEKKNTIEE